MAYYTFHVEKPVLGLDFGTTKMIAAWIGADGKVVFAAGDEGVSEIPSVASYQGTRGSTVLGTEARKLFSIDPKRTVVGVKRFLGRRFQSDFVGRSRQQFFYPLVEGPGGLTAVEQRGEIIPLERVAARLVGQIVEHANAGLGVPFEQCVVACPAHFTQRQRRALKEVVESCGLEVVAMILEPTAAALTLPDPDRERTLLVYDLGGGTFDTTVLRVESGVVRVLATGGDALLGGFELDQKIAAELIDIFKRDHGVDLRDNPLAMHTLVDAVEAAKIALTTADSAPLSVTLVDQKRGLITLERTLTRGELDAFVAPLVEKTIGIAQDALKQAGLTPAELDDVLVVGSQTRMPYIQKRVTEAFGKTPNPSVDPTRCVAVGAAVLGGAEQMLFDALAMPICLMSPGAAPLELLPKNTRVPATLANELERPPGPLLGVVYEATDVAAIDRDVLGRLVLPADWHATHPGPYTLEVRCTAAFDLSFAVSAGGERVALSLDDPARPASPAPSAERACDLACMVRTSAGGAPVPMKAVRVGPTAMALEGRALPAGPVEVSVRRGRDIHVVRGTVDAANARAVRLQPGDALTRLLASLPPA